MQALENIRHIICVASGKGGVGKSTTAVNLAVALRQQGFTVGLLDADVYGPSQPTMLGVAPGTRPQVHPGRQMDPVEAHGIYSMSIGYLVEPQTAMVWRAPMIVGAFNQMLGNTRWPSLDFLIIDMPPGTGDIQLSLAQSVALRGAIIVTTPQDVALDDARKGIEMFRKVQVPLLGVVENMALHVCSHCGHSEAIFGHGGAERLSVDYGVQVIGSLPLHRQIREQADRGDPLVMCEPEGELAGAYHDLARRVAQEAEALAQNPATVPQIDVSDN